MSYEVWRVIVNEQDGTGGGNPVDKLFIDYDDAHDYYLFIKEQAGKPFHPSISKPPHPFKLVHDVCPKGERYWRPPFILRSSKKRSEVPR